jgi:hypothetical protein
MKRKTIITLLVISSMILSCRKKEKPSVEPEPTASSTPTTPTPGKEFLPLKIGNYWIYQIDLRDHNDSLISTSTDSLYVFDTVTVRNRLFYKMMSNSLYNLNVTSADSANCIIDSDGNIRMKTSGPGDTLFKQDIPQVPIFYCITQKNTPNTFSFNGTTYSNCVNALKHAHTSFCTTEWNNLYCKGVGIVYDRLVFASTACTQYYEQKLLRYKVN